MLKFVYDSNYQIYAVINKKEYIWISFGWQMSIIAIYKVKTGNTIFIAF